MKVKKFLVEVYKWLPFWLAILYILNIYFYKPSTWLGILHLVFFFVAFIPFIFIHSIVCRVIYTKCKSEEDGHYEL